jgi:hypothetical protein
VAQRAKTTLVTGGVGYIGAMWYWPRPVNGSSRAGSGAPWAGNHATMARFNRADDRWLGNAGWGERTPGRAPANLERALRGWLRRGAGTMIANGIRALW